MGPIDQFKVFNFLYIGPIGFTNSALAMALTCAFTFYFLYVLPHTSQYFAILSELYYDFIRGMCESIIKHDYDFLIPFVSSVFLFTLFGNLIGLIPGFFTFTSHLSSNMLISGAVVLGVVAVAIARHGLRFVRLFAPSGVPLWLLPILVPIELISFSLRIFSLAVRLMINMCVGHMTLKVLLILSTKFSLAGPLVGLIYVPFLFLELGVAFLQSYIFLILTCVYMKDGVELGH